MSTLAHVFEAEGIATIALGSVRKQIESAAPPRGLLCNFPLGRPLGKPEDPVFQHRVLSQAFALLQTSHPVLEEFPETVEEGGRGGLSCPLPPRSDTGLHPALDEIRGLRPAYDRTVAKYGNRAGASRVVAVDQLENAMESLLRVVNGTPWKQAGIPGIPSRVAQDIRGYYELAALGLTDHVPAAWSGANWFFDNTEAGKVLLAARKIMQNTGEKRPIWFYMAPGDR